MAYEFRNGARVAKGLTAEVVGEELERIRTSNGGQLVTDHVVESAKPKDAPLHTAFTWDNRAAGNKWRKHEARNLIRSVRVVHDDEDKTESAAFVHVNIGDGYYQSTEIAVRSVDEYASAVETLAGKIHSAQRALEDLQTVARGQPDTDQAMLAGVIAQAFLTANAALQKMVVH